MYDVHSNHDLGMVETIYTLNSTNKLKDKILYQGLAQVIHEVMFSEASLMAYSSLSFMYISK